MSVSLIDKSLTCDSKKNSVYRKEEMGYTPQHWAPPHWAKSVRQWLSNTLPRRWMGRGSPNLPWPANSPDLTPCDFFLWGYLKSRVYRTQPVDLHDLKERIMNEFQHLATTDFVQRSIDSYEHRLHRCVEVNGAHVE